jgi:PAT family beta-lactamase induction signal transducer AmpG
MGLSNATLGFCMGLVIFAVPQLLAAEHVPEAKIAALTALAISPNFFYFVLGPMLDVRLSRRWYATVMALMASLCAGVAILNLQHFVVLEVALMMLAMSSNLSSAALCGWLAHIVDPRDTNVLSRWLNTALISGAGVTALLGGQLVLHLPIVVAAVLVAAVIFLPTAVFPWMPAPGPDRRLAAESFGQFNREVLMLLGRREVVIVLLLFLSPCSSFALTSMLGALGADFGASAHMVSLAGGGGAILPGLIGCFFYPILAKKISLRNFYVANGIVGSVFTLILIVLPRVPWVFALALFGEFLFQALAFSIQIGIVYEVIGPNNPLAATTFALLTAATNVPITYILVTDGHGYNLGGLAGLFATDALIGIVACSLAWLILRLYCPERFGAVAERVVATEAVGEEA